MQPLRESVVDHTLARRRRRITLASRPEVTIHQPQTKARVEFSTVMRAATRQTCNGAFYAPSTRKIVLAIGTSVEISPGQMGEREGQVVTALLVGDSQIAARSAPFVSVRQNSATARAKLSENMSEFVSQSAIDFRRMLKQPWV